MGEGPGTARAKAPGRIAIPGWTQRSNAFGGRDPVGLQAWSQAAVAHLVPGMTSITKHLRYYSLHCWLISHCPPNATSQDQQRRVRRAEVTIGLAALLGQPGATGISGEEALSPVIPRIAAQPPNAEVDIRPHSDDPKSPGRYLKAEGGAFGSVYLPSERDMGLVEDFAAVSRADTRPCGASLAAAYGKSLGQSASRHLIGAMETGKITPAGLRLLAQVAGLEFVPPGSEEERLLRQCLAEPDRFHDAPISVRDAAARRAQSVRLLLTLAQGGVPSNDPVKLREVLFRGSPAPGAAPLNHPDLHRWRALFTNEHARIALECLLNALADVAQQQGAGIPPDNAVTSLIHSCLPTIGTNVTLSDWAASLDASALNEDLGLASMGAAGGRRKPLRSPTRDECAAALRSIAILWRQTPASGPVRLLLRSPVREGTSRRSAAAPLADFDANSQMPALQALVAVMRRHVVDRHLAIAASKLVQTRNYTYQLQMTDGLLHDGEIAASGYTQTRLVTLSAYLRSVGLLGPDYRISSVGQGYLEA